MTCVLSIVLIQSQQQPIEKPHRFWWVFYRVKLDGRQLQGIGGPWFSRCFQLSLNPCKSPEVLHIMCVWSEIMAPLQSVRVLPLTRGGFKILPLVWVGQFILFALDIKYPRQGLSQWACKQKSLTIKSTALLPDLGHKYILSNLRPWYKALVILAV